MHFGVVEAGPLAVHLMEKSALARNDHIEILGLALDGPTCVLREMYYDLLRWLRFGSKCRRISLNAHF